MRNQEEQEIQPTQTRLELIHGDIIDAEADAIVNPTDLVMSGSGGLDQVIRQAAGSGVDLHVRRFAISRRVVKQVRQLLLRPVTSLQDISFTPSDQFGQEVELGNEVA